MVIKQQGEDNRPPICPTDGDTIAVKKHRSNVGIDKQSLDYVLRSGLAGGLAGCAVRYFRLTQQAISTISHAFFRPKQSLDRLTGSKSSFRLRAPNSQSTRGHGLAL